MIQKRTVTLKCCETLVSIIFVRREAPGLPIGEYRKNVDCPQCWKLIIVTLIKSEGVDQIEQEILDLR